MRSGIMIYECRNCKEKFTENYSADVLTTLHDPIERVALHECCKGEYGVADLVGVHSC